MRPLIAAFICVGAAIGFPVIFWEQTIINYEAMLGFFCSHDYWNGFVYLLFVLAVPIGSLALIGCGVGWIWIFFRMRTLLQADKENKTFETQPSFSEGLDSHMSIDDIIAQIDSSTDELEGGSTKRK